MKIKNKYIKNMMKNINIIILIIIIISNTAILAIAANDFGKYEKNDLNILNIKKDIKKNGVKITVANLYSKPKTWDRLLNKIAIGKSEYLELAVLLKKGSDAGTSEMLSKAVGEALENAPELVLQIAPQEFKLEDICGCPDIDSAKYSTCNLALRSVEKRIKGLDKITNKQIEQKTIVCKKLLKESITGIKSFYGIKNCGYE